MAKKSKKSRVLVRTCLRCGKVRKFLSAKEAPKYCDSCGSANHSASWEDAS